MIEIQNYSEESVFGKQDICAVFEIYFPKIQLTCRQLKLCVGKNGKYYIRFPSYMVRERDDGKKEWGKLWEFSKERQHELVKCIETTLQPYKPGITLC